MREETATAEGIARGCPFRAAEEVAADEESQPRGGRSTPNAAPAEVRAATATEGREVENETTTPPVSDSIIGGWGAPVASGSPQRSRRAPLFGIILQAPLTQQGCGPHPR